jgi:hypothetical protein
MMLPEAKSDRAKLMGERLKGMVVRHSVSEYSRSFAYEGRVVGYSIPHESVIVESADQHHPDQIPVPEKGWTMLCKPRRATYLSALAPALINPEPAYPKRAIIEHFSNTCTRCLHPAIIGFNIIQCSWWSCPCWYLR